MTLYTYIRESRARFWADWRRAWEDWSVLVHQLSGDCSLRMASSSSRDKIDEAGEVVFIIAGAAILPGKHREKEGMGRFGDQLLFYVHFL